ncbi:hypothetical protein [Nannocystis pusilla]|uniref:hypothetical protein n=1 Tax=Nannocystis pusilla TaxID=889268 RepID=UPI003BF09741
MNSLMILVMIFAAFGIYGAVSERSVAARRRGLRGALTRSLAARSYTSRVDDEVR